MTTNQEPCWVRHGSSIGWREALVLLVLVPLAAVVYILRKIL
jgi:hypothetical protein